MKKRILLFAAIGGIAVITMTSGQTGAGAESGFNCTGAETGSGNSAGCSQGGTCHSAGATAGITVSLELDSAGSPITHYAAGVTYSVKIKGTNTTTNTLPKFGFQVTCIKGSVAVSAPDSAGKMATTGLPANVKYTPPHSGEFVCPLIEHSAPITAATLGGATGAVYLDSFQWTAPAVGTGVVSIWGALNAVNNNTSSTGDFWNTTHLVLNEAVPSSVTNVINNINVSAYPNPVSNILNLQFNNAPPGNYTLQVFDLSSRCISNENFEVNSNQVTNINTSSWAPGLYQVVIQKEGINQIVRVVKNL
jgi:hypothetical protein